MNRYEKLAAIDCSAHVEKKDGLSYLSWAWAWDQLKRLYPDSNYTVHESREGLPYFTDGRTCWCKVSVSLNDGDNRLEHTEILPVMDNRNRSITLETITSMDVNKTIQRAITKAIARHGLGLYLYAGEDLPMESSEPAPDIHAVPASREPSAAPLEAPPKPAKITVQPFVPKVEETPKITVLKPVELPEPEMQEDGFYCADCGVLIEPVTCRGVTHNPGELAARSMLRFRAVLCRDCAKSRKAQG